MTRSLAGSFAFCGVAVERGAGVQVVQATAPGIVAEADAMFRVASVSKVVVGRLLERVAGKVGLDPPYAMDASAALGWSLRHPAFPERPVTLGMLASHSAGLTDAVGTVPAGQDLQQFISGTGKIWGPHAPGQFFAYSNLGFVLLAAAIERMTDRRFGDLARDDFLRPLGITGGFNWSGVAPEDRAAALPTYRRRAEDFVPQIDAVVPAQGVIGAGGMAVDLSGYAPGDNPAVFSPQGGLRISLREMGVLAASLRGVAPPVLWRRSDGPGDYLDGVFADMGAGLQVFDTPAFYPRPLIGHFGNAYGFNGGVWYDRRRDLAFAYALNGLPMGDESDAFSQAELQIFAAIAALED